MKKRYFSELMRLDTFEERYNYLKLVGEVGNPTFGYNRYFNQRFYHSSEWRNVRNEVILRDNGCDLGVPDYEIHGRIYIHHINPITLQDIETLSDNLLNPDNLICVTFDTHNAIHYGDERTLPKVPLQRTPGDTCPWR